jgi:hypothetical protein
MSDTIQSNSDIPKTNLQQKVALVDFPLFCSIGTTIILILVLWVSNSIKIFPAIAFSTVSLIAIAITSFFSTWTIFLILKFQRSTRTDDLKKGNLAYSSNENLTILQIKILGLLALFVGYIAWFTLIQNEFAPPDAIERDVAVVAFRKTGPAVWFSPLLGSIGFAASLLWSIRRTRNIETDLPVYEDVGNSNSNNQVNLLNVNISNIKPIQNSKSNENVQVLFKFHDKISYSKIKLSPVIKIESYSRLSTTWKVLAEPKPSWRVELNDKDFSFSAYSEVPISETRKLRCTLDLPSLNLNELKISPEGGVEFWPLNT